jgi:hypothetical protein
MDFSVFEPILALHDRLVDSLAQLTPPPAAATGATTKEAHPPAAPKAVVALLQRAYEQHDQLTVALASARKGAGVRIKNIMRDVAAPLDMRRFAEKAAAAPKTDKPPVRARSKRKSKPGR